MCNNYIYVGYPLGGSCPALLCYNVTLAKA
jgi:hypothetical protein